MGRHLTGKPGSHARRGGDAQRGSSPRRHGAATGGRLSYRDAMRGTGAHAQKARTRSGGLATSRGRDAGRSPRVSREDASRISTSQVNLGQQAQQLSAPRAGLGQQPQQRPATQAAMSARAQGKFGAALLAALALALVVVALLVMRTCAAGTQSPAAGEGGVQPIVSNMVSEVAAQQAASQKKAKSSKTSTVKKWNKKKDATFSFVDANGDTKTGKTDFSLEKCQFDRSKFKLESSGLMTYAGKGYTCLQGVDVSAAEGKINWKKVKKAGYDFAILQVGFRGYESGSINKDDNFEANYKGAKAAGLKVGAYFFAQALNKAEAVKEASSAIKMLKGRKLDLPLFYDPETVQAEDSRTNYVGGEKFTSSAVTFCKAVKKAGYDTGVYMTLSWAAFEFDMDKLKDYKLWIADYNDKPQCPYAFGFWQYSYQTKVPGIDDPCDVNVMLVPKKS